ncbi:hypothetical protein V5E97_01250 [Singulisphaera sp. Ch08]|uniref:Uncharacterized protein n=1 Tax=Singulisphaera sp. Ch08 TaxID=3120278 RepID=A0AAU7CH52_9BACT
MAPNVTSLLDDHAASLLKIQEQLKAQNKMLVIRTKRAHDQLKSVIEKNAALHKWASRLDELLSKSGRSETSFRYLSFMFLAMMMGFVGLACYQYREIQDQANERKELVSKIDTLERKMVSQVQGQANERKELVSKIDTLERTMASRVQDQANERKELVSKIDMLERMMVSRVQDQAGERKELDSKIDMLERMMVSRVQDQAGERKELDSKIDMLERMMVSRVQDQASERKELVSKIDTLEQILVAQEYKDIVKSANMLGTQNAAERSGQNVESTAIVTSAPSTISAPAK